MSIEEGLKSTDVVKIKEARGRAKGLVTKYSKKLQADLLIEDNEFLLDEIKSDEVQELFQKLDKSQNDFEDLHERYLEYLQDKSGLESEENYAAEVERNFSATKRSYMKYKKALAVSIEKEKKEKNIAVLANEIKFAKARLESKKKAASRVVKSSDEYERSTADQMRKELSEVFMNYESKTAEYEIATISIKDEQSEGKYAPSGDITADREEIDVLMMQLSAVLFKAKALGESIYKETSNSIDAQSNQINVMTEDSALKTKIVLLADTMEINRTKFEDNSIKDPVDVGAENATLKAKVE